MWKRNKLSKNSKFFKKFSSQIKLRGTDYVKNWHFIKSNKFNHTITNKKGNKLKNNYPTQNILLNRFIWGLNYSLEQKIKFEENPILYQLLL